MNRFLIITLVAFSVFSCQSRVYQEDRSAFEKAHKDFKAKDYVAAKDKLESFVKSFPTSPFLASAQVLLAESLYLSEGDAAGAAFQLGQVVQLSNTPPQLLGRSYMTLAQVYGELGQDDLKASALSDAQKLRSKLVPLKRDIELPLLLAMQAASLNDAENSVNFQNQVMGALVEYRQIQDQRVQTQVNLAIFGLAENLRSPENPDRLIGYVRSLRALQPFLLQLIEGPDTEVSVLSRKRLEEIYFLTWVKIKGLNLNRSPQFEIATLELLRMHDEAKFNLLKGMTSVSQQQIESFEASLKNLRKDMESELVAGVEGLPKTAEIMRFAGLKREGRIVDEGGERKIKNPEAYLLIDLDSDLDPNLNQ